MISIPRHLAVGDLVAVMPDKCRSPISWSSAAHRAALPLMKRVAAALPGQQVCRTTGNAVTVDTVPIGGALDRDTHGRPLPFVWKGCRRIADGDIFR